MCTFLSNKLLTKSDANGIIYIETRKKHKTRKRGTKMRAKEIKETIRHEVREAWERLCLHSDVFGEDDDLTVSARKEWAVLDNLWTKLYGNERY